ncbi:MAG TPA: hypothetical protein DHU55_13615 [Blastocatellia bacterium]|jgi:hypothetical protein|nr:hypothetical protein [Blastocatellia bacterium]
MRRLQRTKYRKRRCSPDGLFLLHLNGNSGFTKAGFYELLEKSAFVSHVIDIHREDANRVLEYSQQFESPDLVSQAPVLRLFEAFVEKHLPDWLYGITDILTLQAKFAAKGTPMSRAELTALIDDAFLDSELDDLPLKDGRNEIWDAYTLKAALNHVLPEIKTIGALTLTNVAKRINAGSNQLLPGRMKKPLSGKHLQKLLKKHNIDWVKIKKSYKKRLIAEKKCPIEMR